MDTDPPIERTITKKPGTKKKAKTRAPKKMAAGAKSIAKRAAAARTTRIKRKRK
jgi:hypothetical protein